MTRFELYICHSDRTWTDGHFVDMDVRSHDEDADLLEELKTKYLKEHPNTDIVFLGIYHMEDFEENEK